MRLADPLDRLTLTHGRAPISFQALPEKNICAIKPKSALNIFLGGFRAGGLETMSTGTLTFCTPKGFRCAYSSLLQRVFVCRCHESVPFFLFSLVRHLSQCAQHKVPLVCFLGFVAPKRRSAKGLKSILGPAKSGLPLSLRLVRFQVAAASLEQLRLRVHHLRHGERLAGHARLHRAALGAGEDPHTGWGLGARRSFFRAQPVVQLLRFSASVFSFFGGSTSRVLSRVVESRGLFPLL